VYKRQDLESAATTLSVESQAKTLSLAVVAPLLGLAVDRLAGPAAVAAKQIPMEALWPVAAAGALACLLGLAVNFFGHRRHMGMGQGNDLREPPQGERQ